MRTYFLCFSLMLLLGGCDGKSSYRYYYPLDSYLGLGFSYTVWTVAPAVDGSNDIYVGGQFAGFNGYQVNGIVRLNANGSLDAGFDMGSGFDGSVFAITPASDGSGDIYVAGGFTSYNGSAANRIIRLHADGSVDTGFSSGQGFNNAVYTLAVATDGSGDIYAGGDFASYNGNASPRIVRINSDGTFDAGFAVGVGANDAVNSIAVVAGAGEDQVYIGGAFSFVDTTPSNYIARLHNDGSVDTGFVVGSGFDNSVEALSPAADGSGDIYVGGRFLNYNTNAAVRIARLNSDGSFDPTFATSTGFNGTVYTIATDSATPSRIFIAGAFTSYDSNTHNRISCLNSAGFTCSGFDSGTGFDYVVLAMAFSNDGSNDLLVGGDFFYYRGSPHYRLARLNSSGDAL